jgi:hypothetical protein
MRQVRIRVTCDACAAWKSRDTDDGVQTVPVVAGHTLDLCADHREGLRAVLALIAEWGAAPETAGRKRATAPVVATGAPQAPATNGNAPTKRGGKRARQRRANAAAAVPASDLPLALVCPLCQMPSASGDSLGHHLRAMHSTTTMAVYGDTCPVCGTQGTARGLGSHGGHAHGISGTAALFAVAQQQGDPFGVIASRVQALASQAAR